MAEQQVVVRHAGEGPATWAMQSLFERLVGVDDGVEALGVSLVTQPPGVATPLHVHTAESEGVYVLDGSLTYRAGEQLHRLTAGAFLFLPRGLPHAFRITGSTPARLLVLATPGRLLHLYDDVGMPAGERRLPGEDGQPFADEIARWGEHAPGYGLQVVGPPIPEDA